MVKLPIGIESFEEIRTEGFYYADKTSMIEELIENPAKVMVFTRPRRFGKTLAMSMLRCFFDINSDSSLFDGLYISRCRKLCEEYMGSFPVISISLKGVDGRTFDFARYRLNAIIAEAAERFSFLRESPALSETDRKLFMSLTEVRNGRYHMDEETLSSSLKLLSRLLFLHYGKKAVILIDEYDVPLDKAFSNGYYNEMMTLIRALLSDALKTNDYLQLAVLTGCLRIGRESIFTGLNNFRVFSVTDTRFDDQFGFTEEEVKALLGYYNLENRLAETKKWYDGYRFGKADVYCPWDVINHADSLRDDADAEPQAYWINTSSNDLVRRFIDRADRKTKDELEKLLSGESIEKTIRQELTYDELDTTIDNMWSLLFATGYLTYTEKTGLNTFRLRIPNEEVRTVYRFQIREWFSSTVENDKEGIKAFWKSFRDGCTEEVEKYLNAMLSRSISVFDAKGRNEEKEVSYHMIVMALLAANPHWITRSNAEAGDGFADIIVLPEDPDAGIIVEIKYTETFQQLESRAEDAIMQIKDRHYDLCLRNDGRNDILIYGMAFNKKRCRVLCDSNIS
ncbi:MAG: AAA family ATPase [Bullifex sp.]